ncbi:Rsph3 [Acrasis kona]|uniref:Rsph3 n=1 Tax=Acrasis kona TaxID=1008807 RepID=A0AAW2ZSA2_9EUKA
MKKLKEQQEKDKTVETTQPDEDAKSEGIIEQEDYLEPILDREIEEDLSTATAGFENRPPSPLFIAAKSGVEVGTQIEEDIFKFDHEVEPLLEILVGKTLEQSMLEVLREEEVQADKEQKRLFEQLRSAELAEAQKLEAMEVRREEEVNIRMKQEIAKKQQESQAKEKLSSKAFAKTFFSNLETSVFSTLEDQGYFYDVVQRDIEDNFMPWLIHSVQANMDRNKSARQMMDDIIKMTVRRIIDTGNKAREKHNVNTCNCPSCVEIRAQKEALESNEESELEIDLGATMRITPDMIKQEE